MSQMTIDQALQLALQHHNGGRLGEAEALYRQILAVQPDHVLVLSYLGILAGQAGRVEEAVRLLQQAISKSPADGRLYATMGRLLNGAGRTADALGYCQRAVQLAPQWVEGQFELGVALQTLERRQEAMAAYQQVLRLQSNHIEALNNLGNLLKDLRQFDEAIACYRRALAISPKFLPAVGNLANALDLKGDYEQSVHYGEEALKIDPDNAVVWCNLGSALAALKRSQEARVAFENAIARRPDYVAAHNNLGSVWRDIGNLDKAMACYKEALRFGPRTVEACNNLACVLCEAGLIDEGIACYQRARELNPTFTRSHSNLVYMQLFHPGYDGAAIKTALEEWNFQHAAPFRALWKPHGNTRDPERKLRIGYVSPDFRDHVVGRNMLPLFREHDRSKVEIYAYSCGVVKDASTQLFQKYAHVWREIIHLSDAAAADQIRRDQIDILVDLTLHLDGSRLVIFAYKPAPLQVTFAGYPGSTGLEAMDYRLSDIYLDPPGMHDEDYCEKSIRLPNCFWCYDPLGIKLEANELPAKSKGYITFGCLNNFCKVQEPTLRLWAQSMRESDKRTAKASRLIMLMPEGTHRQRVLNLFRDEGIASDRIDFYGKLPREEYLSLYHKIDIALDTLPYNGHTTSLDALWMGVPVLSLLGSRVVGRAGYSQLMNLNMKEWIATSQDEYVEKVAAYSANWPWLMELRRGLRNKMEHSPIMDAKGFARAIEEAYRGIWLKWCAASVA